MAAKVPLIEKKCTTQLFGMYTTTSKGYVITICDHIMRCNKI